MHVKPLSVPGAFVLTVFATACAAPRHIQADDAFSARWSGVNGSWSQSALWQPDVVPKNSPGVEYFVTIDGGSVTADVPVVISRLTINDATLNLEQPVSTESFVFDGGLITGTAGFAVGGDLVIKRGTLNNTATSPNGFTVGGDVIKRGYGFAALAPFDGHGSYDILIEQGTLRPLNGGWGSDGGDAIVAASQFARIMANDTSNLSDDVYLNNARGFANSGAIVTLLSSGGNITGDLYLGDRLAALGPQDVLNIYGKVHGGSLEIASNGTLSIRSDSHTYAGTTLVGIHGQSTELVLDDGGSIQSTSGITVGGHARLVLNNNRQELSNRLPDSAPITSLGGRIIFFREGDPLTEQVGQLVLSQGATEVNAGANSSSWAFEGLTRLPLATVDFDRSGNFGPTIPSIRFSTAPQLTNSILGGWATLADEDFASYDAANGIVPLGNRVSRPTQIQSANSGDHIRVDSGASPLAPLTSDRQIGTLSIDVGGTEVDLSGHRLTLEDGGLIIDGSSQFGTTIRDGLLTAGRSSAPAALYFHAHGTRFGQNYDDVELSAAITDNPFGGEVSVVKSGGSTATLSGANSYSGMTVIQDGGLGFAAPGSLPSAGRLWVDGGNARFNFQSAQPQHLAVLRLSQGGRVEQGPGFIAEINADQYVLESGSVSIPMAGGGMLRKTTGGLVELKVDSVNFQGDIVVEDGVLVAGSAGSVTRAPYALGRGRSSVLPNGTLIHSAVANGAAYMLLNADLDLDGGDVGLGVAIDTHRWDFAGVWHVRAPSRVLMFDFRGDDQIGSDANVRVLERATLANSSGLTVLGEGLLDFMGGIELAGRSFLDVGEGAVVRLNSLASSATASSLELRGGGIVRLPLVLSSNAEHPFTVKVNPDAMIEPASGKAIIGEGVTFVMNGTTTNNATFFTDGGTLTGGAVDGDINNVRGTLAPGNGVGEMLAQRITQAAEGTLAIEIQGGPTPIADMVRAGDVSLAGVLHASVLQGGSLAPGSEFDVVIAESLSIQGLRLSTDGFQGLLTTVPIIAGPDAGKTALRLSVVVPEPASIFLAALGCLMLECCRLAGRRRQTYGQAAAGVAS